MARNGKIYRQYVKKARWVRSVKKQLIREMVRAYGCLNVRLGAGGKITADVPLGTVDTVEVEYTYEK